MRFLDILYFFDFQYYSVFEKKLYNAILLLTVQNNLREINDNFNHQ